MNNVNNNRYYEEPEEKEIDDEPHWENEEYREGKPLRRFPAHTKYQRVVEKVDGKNRSR